MLFAAINKPASTTLQTQARQTETAIKEEFERLYQFLREEEEVRLRALRREEETKFQVMSNKLENIKDQIATLSATVTYVQTSLREEDLPFLQVHLQPVLCDYL